MTGRLAGPATGSRGGDLIAGDAAELEDAKDGFLDEVVRATGAGGDADDGMRSWPSSFPA